MQNSELKNIAGNEGRNQRITEQLKEFWLRAKQGREFPNEADIDIEAIGELWNSCFLVKYDENIPQKFGYLYLGDELMAAYGDDFNQREECEKLIFPSVDPVISQFNQVKTQRAWLEHDGEFINSKGLLIRYRSIILPLGNGNVNSNNINEIGFLIGAMRWKSYL